MHGVIQPVPALAEPPGRGARLRLATGWLVPRRWFLALVVLPALLVTGYYYLIAADQYLSEAHFSVGAGGTTTASPGGFGELIGLGAASQSQAAAMSVGEYLRSHDVLSELERKVDVAAMYRRPGIDLLSRLPDSSTSPEAQLKYFRRYVNVRYDRDTGLTELRVRAFRPDDAYRLGNALLELGERRVNQMNARSYADALRSARQQLGDAEQAVAAAGGRTTAFRQASGDINPASSGEAQLGVVSQLRANLSNARAQLASLAGVISPSSPQYVALSRQVRSLSGELAVQSSRLAGGGGAIASDLGSYEGLQIRQQFAAKRYEAAAAALEAARAEARRQQLYLVRVVDINRPVKSLYPQRGQIVLTVLIALLLVFSIGWLIAAGVREHAA